MGTIRYEILAGDLPMTVDLLEGAVVIDTNIHAVYEEGSFTSIPDGDYTLRYTDPYGCTAEESLTFCLDCPEGYTATISGCYKRVTTTATLPSASIDLSSKTNGAYTNYGTLIFSSYNSDGTGTYETIPFSNGWWVNPLFTTTEGPLNRCGVWADFVTNNQDIGFSICLDILVSKSYYIGVGCDNNAKIYLNGELLIEQNPAAIKVMTGTGSPVDQVCHKYWFVYPVEMDAGLNILEVYGHNITNVAAVGIEVYNLTKKQLIAATSYVDMGDGLVFSSKDYIGQLVTLGDFGVGYSCPDGYALVTCDGAYYCARILQLECGEEPDTTTTTEAVTTTTTSVPIGILTFDTTKTSGNYVSLLFVGSSGGNNSFDWEWDMGDGNILTGLIYIYRYYYSVGGTKTVTVITPSINWDYFSYIQLSSNNITGTLDLSAFTKFFTNSTLSVGSNTTITSIILPTMVSGAISTLYTWYTGISTLDLSTLLYYNTLCSIITNNCPSLTSITMPTTLAVIATFDAYSCDLGYIDFTGMTNILKKNDSKVRLHNNAMTSTEVNHILVDIASLVSEEGAGGDYTGRTIDIGGTNACPDYTSGGYDGWAAVNTLESKGITVTLATGCSEPTTTTTTI